MIYELIHRIESLSIDRRVTTIRKGFGYFGIRKEKDDLWIDSSHRESINR